MYFYLYVHSPFFHFCRLCKALLMNCVVYCCVWVLRGEIVSESHVKTPMNVLNLTCKYLFTCFFLLEFRETHTANECVVHAQKQKWHLSFLLGCVQNYNCMKLIHSSETNSEEKITICCPPISLQSEQNITLQLSLFHVAFNTLCYEMSYILEYPKDINSHWNKIWYQQQLSTEHGLQYKCAFTFQPSCLSAESNSLSDLSEDRRSQFPSPAVP